jgi:hypothetical protein
MVHALNSLRARVTEYSIGPHRSLRPLDFSSVAAMFSLLIRKDRMIGTHRSLLTTEVEELLKYIFLPSFMRRILR